VDGHYDLEGWEKAEELEEDVEEGKEKKNSISTSILWHLAQIVVVWDQKGTNAMTPKTSWQCSTYMMSISDEDKYEEEEGEVACIQR